jgi:phospholipid/cholesterol/gamma-HCH transport system substrate-binding protein
MMVDKTKALTWTELRVGVVAIISLSVLAFTILYIGSGGGSPLARKYVVKALMADVNGLKPGAPVRVGGVEVGTVTQVDFAPGEGRGLVEVVMRLDGRVKAQVTTESRATLGALGLLGEKAVDITASPRGVPIEDGNYVLADAEDPFKGLLTDASQSTAHLRRILSRMDAGEGLVGKALRDEELYNRMNDISIRLQGLMYKLESDRGPLGRLVNDQEMSQHLSSSMRGLETVVSRVEAGQGSLGALSKDDELAHDLKALVARMGDVVERLNKGEGTAGRLLHDDVIFRRFDDLSQRLDSVLQRIERSEGTAGRLMNDPELYNNLNATLKEAHGLVADIRKDPGKYLRLKLSLF